MMMYPTSGVLFRSGGTVEAFKLSAIRAISSRCSSLGAGDFGDTDEQLVGKVVAGFDEHFLIMKRDDVYLDEPSVSYGSRDRFSGAAVKILNTVAHLPFDGNAELLHLQPNPSTDPPVAGSVQTEVILQVRATSDRELDSRVKALVDQVLIEADRVNRSVQNQKLELRAIAARQVAARRADVVGARTLGKSMSFPVRRRDDADRYRVPVTRRQTRPMRPAIAPGRSASPDPVLDAADYEAALDTLVNARSALERSPSLVGRLNEELIRDVLLLSLNAQFTGAAAGEVFNGAGKPTS